MKAIKEDDPTTGAFNEVAHGHRVMFESLNIKQETDELDVGCIQLQPPDIYYDMLEVKTEVSDVDVSVSQGSPGIMEAAHDPRHTQVSISVKEEIPVESNSKYLQCDTCSELFETKLSLLRHIKKMHSGIKSFGRSRGQTSKISFECVNCSLKFTKRREKTFAYSQCDHKAVSSGALKNHIKHHTDEKHFACPHCEYKTVARHNLTKHVRRHTADKPYACSQCEYRAVSIHTLRRHTVRHTGEKAFACSRCDFTTSRNSYLKEHIRRHTGEKPFACSRCDYKAYFKYELKLHMTRHVDINVKI